MFKFESYYEVLFFFISFENISCFGFSFFVVFGVGLGISLFIIGVIGGFLGFRMLYRVGF